MGVRVYDAETDSCEENCTNCCYSCNSSTSILGNNKNQQQSNKTKTKTNKSKCSESSNSSNANHYHATTTTTEYITNNNLTHSSKDFVGNSKEFRIENNKKDLKIIGNNNRIRIGQNTGKIQIIGNNTRLKISYNDGNIQYTGNDGRISLGSDSTQQAVNYIGCNGTLKLVNAAKLNSNLKPKVNTQNTNANALGTTTKVKTKSASYGGAASKPEWQQINELLQNQKNNYQKRSMPNLANKSCSHNDYLKNHCQITNNFSFVNNMGNILISNAVNVSV